MDIVLAATSLVLLAPMFLLVAALLHFSLGRRVFVAQQRAGSPGGASRPTRSRPRRPMASGS
jgi:lipopolysaccharide/colanic/teichoic acid biosynthesis glycosyltransferase